MRSIDEGSVTSDAKETQQQTVQIDEGSSSFTSGVDGSPKSVGNAQRRVLFQSHLPRPNCREGQNFRVAAGAGSSNETDTAPKRSSELKEEGNLRVGSSLYKATTDGDGSPKSVGNAQRRVLFQSHLPRPNCREGQNFRVAAGAGASNDTDTAPKRSSELTAEWDFRVAAGAGAS